MKEIFQEVYESYGYEPYDGFQQEWMDQIHNFEQPMRNVVSYGIPLEDAVLAATRNPARELGCLDEIGTIEPGKRADFVVCGAGLERKAVYLGGEQLA